MSLYDPKITGYGRGLAKAKIERESDGRKGHDGEFPFLIAYQLLLKTRP
jgi:hypothetical protein